MIEGESFKWILSCEGNYELGMATWTRTFGDFKDISEQLLENYGENIKGKKESVGVKVIHFQSRYLLGTSKAREFAVGEGNQVKVDDVDKKLLRALCGDARTPLMQAAKMAVVSQKVAAYRIKHLEKEGVILGYRPNIDHNLLGFTHYKIFFYLSNVTKQELRKFKSHLWQMPQVLYIVEEIGMCDIDIEIMLPSTQNLFSFIDSIKLDFPTLIRDYELLILRKTLKINYLPF